MQKSLHPRASVDRLYWKGKNGGKGLIIAEECQNREKKFRFYLTEKEQRLITEVVIEGVASDDENPKNIKTQLLQLLENYAQKGMHSVFMRGTEEKRDGNNSWLWMKNDIGRKKLKD